MPSLTFSREHAVTVLIDGNIVFALIVLVVCVAESVLHVGACEANGKCSLEVGPAAAKVVHCLLRAAGVEHPHGPSQAHQDGLIVRFTSQVR